MLSQFGGEGFNIAIDYFGEGYTSLGQLSKFPRISFSFRTDSIYIDNDWLLQFHKWKDKHGRFYIEKAKSIRYTLRMSGLNFSSICSAIKNRPDFFCSYCSWNSGHAARGGNTPAGRRIKTLNI